MTYPVDNVSSTTDSPTHHLKLADAAGNKVLMRLVRAGGSDAKTRKTLYEDDPEGLARNTYPNQAVRMVGSGGEYADMAPPWKPYEQNTWEGGRGLRYFHKDKTRFSDHGGVLSHVGNQLTLAGLPSYTGGQHGGDQPHEDYALMPDPDSTLIAYLDVYGSARYVARQFTPAYTFDCDGAIIPVALIGTAPGDLRVDIYSNSGGNPNVSLANGTLASADFGTEEMYRQFRVAFNTTVTLTAGTLYWVVFRSVTDGTSSNYWQVLAEATSATTAKQSANGSSWSASSPYRAPCVILCDANAGDKQYQYFTYKHQLYAFAIPQDWVAVSSIYMNGWRGVADSNTGALDKLKDSTQTGWSISVPNGGIVLITSGPGSNEKQPWRRVTGSTSGQLTVDPPWLTEHTTDTEYVVLATNYWTLVGILLDPILDAHVAGDTVYFPAGTKQTIIRFRGYNFGGTWTDEIAYENVNAEKLVSIPDPTQPRTMVFGYNNDHELGPTYFKLMQPPASGDLYRPIGELLAADTPWNASSITNATQSLGSYGTKVTIASGFSTGEVAARDLDTPISIAQGNQVAYLVKSSVGGTNQFSLKLSNRVQAQRSRVLADYVFVRQLDRLEVAGSVSTMVPSTGAHTDKTKLYDGLDDSTDTIPLTTTNDLVIIAAKKFNYIQVNVTVANATASRTLSMEYFNGEEFVSHTITDGTGSTAFGSLGKRSITFTMPGDWGEYTANGFTGYAVRLKVNNTIDAATALGEVSVKNTEAETYITLNRSKDGTTTYGERVNIASGDQVVVGMASDKFSGALFTLANLNTSGDADLIPYYFNGQSIGAVSGFASLTNDGTQSGGRSFGQSGAISWTPPSDWARMAVNGVTGYFIFLDADETMTDDIAIYEVVATPHEEVHEIQSGTITANIPAWVVGTITPGSDAQTDNVVRNVSLYINTDGGAQTIEIIGSIQLISPYPEYKLLGGHRATNIVAYGQGDNILQPYVLFEDQRLHRIDTLNNDLLVPVLVTAMETIADRSNGQAATHSGVYMYFNMGPRLMRYFDGSLESVGPDLDDGLPYDRQGVISAIIPYAGDQVIYAVNAAERNSLFTSAVYLRAGSGVHELYRAPVGEPISALQLQVIPGMKSDRLWIAVNTQLVWVPVTSYTRDPLKDLDEDGNSNFSYIHDGYLDMGKISDGATGLNKVFVSLTLVTERLSSNTTRWVDVYYRADNTTTWTKVTTQITTSPYQEVRFATGYVTCKELQVRLRLHSHGGVDNTPVVKAVFIKGVVIYPANYQYVLTSLIGDYLEDLNGREQTHKASVDMAQLDSWRGQGTPLTLSNQFVPWDNRSVILNSIDGRVAVLDVDDPHREQYVLRLALLDITT